MSQVTDPVLLDSTGQNIVTGISAVVSAIQSRGMPSPSASNPKMDGTASPGTSNDYARSDHVHPENPANAKTAQLAYVETGTTATKTGGYTAGEYICWQGTLYTANTNIAYGTTLSAGTGGNLTECVGGGLNNVKVDHVDYVSTSDLTIAAMSNDFYDVTNVIPSGYEPISGKIINPTVAPQTYLIVWFNDWYGTIRCNVFNFSSLQRTIPTGTTIRIFLAKK